MESLANSSSQYATQEELARAFAHFRPANGSGGGAGASSDATRAEATGSTQFSVPTRRERRLVRFTSPPARPAEGWWEAAFVRTRNASEIAGHGRGSFLMLIVVAYDIADPKRLGTVAKICKDYGVRVQKSIFECHLEPARFETFWEELRAIVHKDEDCLVAYPINAADAAKIRTHGHMACSEAVVSYVF